PLPVPDETVDALSRLIHDSSSATVVTSYRPEREQRACHSRERRGDATASGPDQREIAAGRQARASRRASLPRFTGAGPWDARAQWGVVSAWRSEKFRRVGP